MSRFYDRFILGFFYRHSCFSAKNFRQQVGSFRVVVCYDYKCFIAISGKRAEKLF